MVNDLTKKKLFKVDIIQDKYGTKLREREMLGTDGQNILHNYTLSNQEETNSVETNEDNYLILREAIEAAVRSLKKCKSAGIDNIPAELLICGGEQVIDILKVICDKIWHTGKWQQIGHNPIL